MKRWEFIVCILMFASGYSITAYALQAYGTISDVQGTPVRGAQVTYTDTSNYDKISRTYTDSNGQYSFDPSVVVEANTPVQFLLDQNYPNPFNPSTTIPFTLDVPGNVTLTIYNIMGQRVRILIDEYRDTGRYTVVWDGRDDIGNHVSSGVYLYCMLSNRQSSVRKMLLLDSGGISSAGSAGTIGQHSAKQSAVQSNIYNVEVRRIGYKDYFQMSVGVGEVTQFDVILEPSDQFASVPGGTCQLGDVEGIGNITMLPAHTETVTGFEMSRYEITIEQYVMYLRAAQKTGDIVIAGDVVFGVTGEWSGQAYSATVEEYTHYLTYYTNLPVFLVSWYGAKSFAQYYGYDLPTETEWEYACRGGQQYLFGTDDGTIDQRKANYSPSPSVSPVGSYPGNPFGLYDLSGNVFEWCNDSSTPPGANKTALITQKNATIISARVIRGGGWSNDYTYCRASSRVFGEESFINRVVGFRVVRRLGGVIY
jgi:formylglycine-generating enzyme required for sulfatase activity